MADFGSGQDSASQLRNDILQELLVQSRLGHVRAQVLVDPPHGQIQAVVVDLRVGRMVLGDAAADTDDVPVSEGGVKGLKERVVFEGPVLPLGVVLAVEVGIVGLAVNDHGQNPVVPDAVVKVPPLVVHRGNDVVHDVLQSHVGVSALAHLKHVLELVLKVVELGQLAALDDVAVFSAEVGVGTGVVGGELDNHHSRGSVVFSLDLGGVESVDEVNQPVLEGTPVFVVEGFRTVDEDDHIEDWLPSWLRFGLGKFRFDDKLSAAFAHLVSLAAVLATVGQLVVEEVGHHNVNLSPVKDGVFTSLTWGTVHTRSTLRTLNLAVLAVSALFTLHTSFTDGTTSTGSAHLTPDTSHTLHTDPAVLASGTPVTGLAVSAGSASGTPLARVTDLTGHAGLASDTSSTPVAWGTGVAGPTFTAHLAFDTDGAHGAGPAGLTGSSVLASLALPAVLAGNAWGTVAAGLTGLTVGDVLTVVTVGSAVAGLTVDTVDTVGAVGAVPAFATGDTVFTFAALDTLGLGRNGAVAVTSLGADGVDLVDVLDDTGLFFIGDWAAVFRKGAAVAEAIHGLGVGVLDQGHEVAGLEDGQGADRLFRDEGRAVLA